MEDSLKGVLITLTIIGLFIVSIMSFVVLFPQEQGAAFSSTPDQNNYLIASTLTQNAKANLTGQLTNLNNGSSSGFDQWDITQGFMGSNAIKQSTGTGITSYFSIVFTNIRILATQVFGSGSPIIYALVIFSSLGIGFLIYVVIKFIRTGN